MSDRIKAEEIISKEEHQEIMNTSAKLASQVLNVIADMMDKIKDERHANFVGNQFLGIITQHLFKSALGNAFMSGNEVNVLGRLVISSILEGYNMAQMENAATAAAQTPKEEKH